MEPENVIYFSVFEDFNNNNNNKINENKNVVIYNKKKLNSSITEK
jgi:hypothetical protein